jgi:FkbM family methyltransferase
MLHAIAATKVRGRARIIELLHPHLGPTGSRGTAQVSKLELLVDLSESAHRQLYYGLYERTEADLVRSLLNAGDTFLDFGANIGFFSLIAASQVGPTGQVHAFEPVPDTAARLRSNIERNRFSDVVTVHEVAAWDADGRMPISIDTDGESGWSSLVYKPSGAASEEIATVDIAAYLDRIGVERIAACKIDVEGAEGRVLRALASRFALSLPPVLCELDPTLTQLAGTSPLEVCEQMRDLGYLVWEITGQGLREVERARPPTAGNILFQARNRA